MMENKCSFLVVKRLASAVEVCPTCDIVSKIKIDSNNNVMAECY